MARSVKGVTLAGIRHGRVLGVVLAPEPVN
jgi:hypothetical protein